MFTYGDTSHNLLGIAIYIKVTISAWTITCGLLHGWPTTKEFKVDDSVSRDKSCALNISNCSVVLEM